MSAYHTSVLKSEAVNELRVEIGKRYIDATLGGSGHTLEILRLGGKVLAFDVDTDAIEFARNKIQSELPKLKERTDYFLSHTNFREISSVAASYKFIPVSGVLFDLGVSNYQLNTPDRGFSYRFGDNLLDLRLDQTNGQPAFEYLRKTSYEQLYEDIATFSEEERVRAIVDALYNTRSIKKLQTTGDVLRVIEKVVGSRQSFSVASRIFQALRIVVNDELNALKEALASLDTLVDSGGRVVIISFHSLEDRIVKLWMQNSKWHMVTKKPVVPSIKEQYENKQSRSAKMRVAIKK